MVRQFFREELNPIGISDRTAYKIDKILYNMVRRGIREYLVRWRGYIQDFDSCVHAASVKYIRKFGDAESLLRYSVQQRLA